MAKNKFETFKFESRFSDYEFVNPEFAKVKIYVCYAGKNRNRSNIEKSVLDEMAKSIYGIPVVGEYDKDSQQFKGHGGKVEISDDGFEFIDTTVPYGFVDPTTPFFYEEVTELDGITKNNYLCCYAYLWYKRYSEIETVLKNQNIYKINQSMEIIPTNGDYTDDGYFNIKEGYFSALCLLGSETEPCFENAKATSNFTKEDSLELFKEMKQAFSKYSVEELGGEKIDMAKNKGKKEEDIEKDNDEEEDEDDTLDSKKDDDKEKCALEELEEKYSQLEEELKITKASYVELQENYSAIESEIVELREYKSNIEKAEYEALENEVLSKYTNLEHLDDYKNLIENKDKYSLEDLEKELKVIAFDNGVTLDKKAKKFEKKSFGLTVDKVVDEKKKDLGDWNYFIDKIKK